MKARSPSRDERATIPCPVCGQSFAPFGRARYCSDDCRKQAWRRRHQPPAAPSIVPPAGVTRRAVTVYACDNCDTRALGQQRCEDCGGFMHRVGVGGLCPACDEPVAVADLLGDAIVVDPDHRPPTAAHQGRRR